MFDISSLNPPQRQAVEHLDGPALVLAGAGSGKTRVITCRVARLIEQGVSPSNILGVTFTNKAAREMKERLASMVSESDARKVNLTTFHALGANILREDIERMGYRKPFTIVDDSDQYRILKEVLDESGLGGSSVDENRLLGLFSRAKNAMTTPMGLPEARYNPAMPKVEKLYKLYDQALRNRGAVDFDDLLLLPTLMLQEHGDLRGKYRNRFRYVMVDEYQDTNPLQLQLLQQLVGPPNYNLMVVGDDDQSIYAFRGAVADYILRFEEFFPGTTVIALEQNYRSHGTILEAANSVVARNRSRRDKTLWSDLGAGRPIEIISFDSITTETDYVARRIKAEAAAYGRPLKDFAILFRVGPQARVMEEALRHHQVRYRLVGSQSLFDKKEVRDVSAYLRLLVNPQDELAIRRVINYPSRGIGTRTIAMVDDLTRSDGLGFAAALERLLDLGSITGRQADGAHALLELLERWRHRLRSHGEESLTEFIREYVEDIGIGAAIRAQEKNPNVARVRWAIVEQIAEGIDRYERGSAWERLDDYVSRLALDPASTVEEEDEADEATLMTLHSSKGLEFPFVFMIGLNEGGLPHSRALEEKGGVDEERRLCYVGMTRAREHLVMTRPRTEFKRGQRSALRPSRFLSEIPEHLTQVYTSQETHAETPSDQDRMNLEQIARIRARLSGDKS